MRLKNGTLICVRVATTLKISFKSPTLVLTVYMPIICGVTIHGVKSKSEDFALLKELEEEE